MFGLGEKANYEERIRGAIAKGDKSAAEQAAREAFLDNSSHENLLAWIAGSMFEKQIMSALDLLEKFIDRFPNSLHMPRIYYSDLLARSNKFDAATHHARIYLRNAFDSGAFKALGDSRIVHEGVSRGYLLITAAYTDLGARLYSQRVLEKGLLLGLVPMWESLIKQELSRLRDELSKPENVSLNAQWESFFACGQGADSLYKLCENREFPVMAKRVDLLEGNFRFNPQFKIDDSEMLMLVLVSG